MIIPSIDIMDGRAVQLRRGQKQVLVSLRDPVELAAEFNRYGEVAIIDLDAALGTGDNLKLIRRICRVCDARVGGGIREFERADELLRAGAKKLIIGTSATPAFLCDLPKERVIVALDHIDGEVLEQGWTKNSGEGIFDRAERLKDFCSGYLCTFVAGEGGLGGMDENIVTDLRDRLPRPITAAGGVADTEDAVRILRTGVDLQVGMALYTDQLDPAQAAVECLDWDKSPLIPTIVQEESGDVLMLAYSTRESLLEALKSGQGTYFSRSRNQIWQKGLTSGNSQELLSCRADCDRDTILFTVRQQGPACHTGSPSCFGERKFSLHRLFQIINQRRSNPMPGSYTAKLLEDRNLLSSKIFEEAEEVVKAPDRRNLVWELADLFYFLTVRAAAEGIGLDEIEKELGGRHK